MKKRYSRNRPFNIDQGHSQRAEQNLVVYPLNNSKQLRFLFYYIVGQNISSM